jgi:type I restriction enzyme M protein
MEQSFPAGVYVDVPGLCKVGTLAEIEGQGWSLNPGRYVGVAVGIDDDFEFATRFETLNEELQRLNGEAELLQIRIAESAVNVLVAAG